MQGLKPVIRFGVFEIDPRSGELRKHGLRIQVPGQAVKILNLLLERPGEVVTREELQNALWPSTTFVDYEHSLNSAVKKLREALGDSAGNSRYIETVPRLGYRFIAPSATAHDRPAVTEVAEPPLRAATGQATPQRPTLQRRLLTLGALLVALLAAAAWSGLRRAGAMPFQMVTTTRLTSAGQYLKAAISPDGRYIAHTFVNAGQESLRVRRTTIANDLEIVPPGPVHYLGITFSPDSEAVYYVTHAADGANPALYRVPVMGGTAERLKQGLTSPVTLSPDMNRLAFVRESGNESSLILSDVAGASERRIAFRRLPEVLDYPAWSPDGRLIACSVFDNSIATSAGSRARIVAVNVADGTERTVSGRTFGFIKQLAWLGNGRGLITSARTSESGVYQVWYVPYPDGRARRLTDGLNDHVGASVSADSSQIVTVERRTIASIWRMRSGHTGHPELVVSGSGGSNLPIWMPDGRIVFEKDLDGGQNIWIVNADGTNQRQLTRAGISYCPSVSSDGHRLAYLSDRAGSPAIWTMDVDGGNPSMVLKAYGDTSPQLSPDGRWIAFTGYGTSQWTTLWRVPSGGGQVVRLNGNFWLQPAFSPDGKWIAGFYADRQLNTNSEPTGIAVIGAAGESPLRVFPISPSVSISAGIRWSPDQRELSYVDRRNGIDNIWSQPLSGAAPHQVTRFSEDELFGFDWSRDGRQLVLSRGVQARDVVLIRQAFEK